MRKIKILSRTKDSILLTIEHKNKLLYMIEKIINTDPNIKAFIHNEVELNLVYLITSNEYHDIFELMIQDRMCRILLIIFTFIGNLRFKITKKCRPELAFCVHEENENV